MPFTKLLSEVNLDDVAEVGGKNASLGEMIQALSKQHIPVPDGWVVTASAYRHFVESTDLKDIIRHNLAGLKTKNLKDLADKAAIIRRAFEHTPFPNELELELNKAYQDAKIRFGDSASFAVRSSATAEDLPGASFAGEHETYLNVHGLDEIKVAIKKAFASLFTDRAISYRVDKKFDHFKVALSVTIQQMIRSDKSVSGIMFSLDTESGFPDVVVINASYGLGEMIVQGKVTPDEFLVYKPKLDKFKPLISKKLGTKSVKMVYDADPKDPTKIVDVPESDRAKFSLTDEEVFKLAKWAVAVEKHYTKHYGKWTPMDMEWAKDGISGNLYLVQARPETIHAMKDHNHLTEYVRTQDAKAIVSGASVGNKIATGKARVILKVSDIRNFQAGEILVTEITDPDWEPIMKIAAGIVTDKGGRTSHAAIVSRELGIPCIVGTENATSVIKNGQQITIDTTGSAGNVYNGRLKFKVIQHEINNIPTPKTKVMINIATPDTAFEKSFLPNSGVGLAREEFIIASEIGIHPLALINYSKQTDEIKKKIDDKTQGFRDRSDYYVNQLSSGIAKIAAAFYPKPVIVRLSDFKTNEYRSLIGGDMYEPVEENPMLGWRGASRYYDPEFTPAFELEIRALKKVYEEFGLDNIKILVPFCRTPEEGQKVIDLINKFGMNRRNHKNLHIYVMCEIPSNVILADDFLKIFDGMSIGSNDLTQLTLGLDRDGNARIKNIANENSLALKALVAQAIKICRKNNKYIGICGQAPSDYPDFAKFLVEEGIESISLNPDTVIETTKLIYKTEQSLK
jgi:pyruvate,water dikinase